MYKASVEKITRLLDRTHSICIYDPARPDLVEGLKNRIKSLKDGKGEFKFLLPATSHMCLRDLANVLKTEMLAKMAAFGTKLFEDLENHIKEKPLEEAAQEVGEILSILARFENLIPLKREYCRPELFERLSSNPELLGIQNTHDLLRTISKLLGQELEMDGNLMPALQQKYTTQASQSLLQKYRRKLHAIITHGHQQDIRELIQHCMHGPCVLHLGSDALGCFKAYIEAYTNEGFSSQIQRMQAEVKRLAQERLLVLCKGDLEVFLGRHALHMTDRTAWKEVDFLTMNCAGLADLLLTIDSRQCEGISSSIRLLAATDLSQLFRGMFAIFLKRVKVKKY